MSSPRKPFGRMVFALAAATTAAALVGELRRAGRDAEPTASAQPVAWQQRQALPDDALDGGVAWLNTSGPISLKELRGKIVVLDFWTYCCINCHHVLPDLAKLEEKYKNQIVVIGVHSPKFVAERDVENVRQKVREYGIKHPVVCDSDQIIWNRLGVESWPTLGIIDPEGRIRWADTGEGKLAKMDQVIGDLVKEYGPDGKKLLNDSPAKFFPENEKPYSTGLLFPGKLTADAKGGRLFISDTGHNRIIQTDLAGKNPVLIGAGSTGLTDGAFDKAEFHRPQGTVLVDDVLYVADTENHAIRAVDLKKKKVTTVAGTGRQAQGVSRARTPGAGTKTALNSPWDLAHVPGSRVLYIAMAGPHQIWHLELESDQAGPWAGTGMENITDGPVGAAAFAQPSGLATDGQHLYVADSEVSALRSITLGPGRHTVHTIVGEGLFEFGDVDGRGSEVRLQHCLGVAMGDGKLYVADTYNNKVKVCDPRTRAVATLAGSGKPGEEDKPAAFFQPGGLSVANGKLYVADTNNHKIRVVDLADNSVKTLALDTLGPPVVKPRKPVFVNAKRFKGEAVSLAAERSELNVAVELPIPEGLVLNDESPVPVLIETPGTDGLIDTRDAYGIRVEPPAVRFTVPLKLTRALKKGESIEFRVSAQAFVCNKGSKFCTIKSYVWDVPATVASGGSETLNVRAAEHAATGAGGGR
jgi:thiol-disulfide isomerase/thioredoxin